MKKLLISIITLLMIVTLSGCGCSKKTEPKDEDNKIIEVTNEKLNEEQNLEGLEFTNESITYDGANTHFTSSIKNTTDSTQKLSRVKATVLFENSSKIEQTVELYIYFGEEIKSGETRTTTLVVDTDLRKTLKVDYELIR